MLTAQMNSANAFARSLHGQQCIPAQIYKCLFHTYVFVYVIRLECFRCMTLNCAERTGKIYDLLEVIVIKLLCVSVSACMQPCIRRCLRNAWVGRICLISLALFFRMAINAFIRFCFMDPLRVYGEAVTRITCL